MRRFSHTALNQIQDYDQAAAGDKQSSNFCDREEILLSPKYWAVDDRYGSVDEKGQRDKDEATHQRRLIAFVGAYAHERGTLEQSPSAEQVRASL